MNRIALVLLTIAVLATTSCQPDAGHGADPPAKQPPADPPPTKVPPELVGTWEHSTIDFDLWEKYKPGRYAGRNATPSREAMIIGKDGQAKFYRYEFAFRLYEELVDCEGTVTFDKEGTFTFRPVKGRKRFLDTHHPEKSRDRALTDKELTDPKWAGTRRYVYDGTSKPPTLRITVPSSAPYNWYKRP